MNVKSPAIVFITPPSGEEKRFRRDLGIAYIQSYLQRQGIESQQFVTDRNPTLDHLVDELLGSRPSLLGIKLYDTNYYIAKLIAAAARQRARQLGHRLRIIAGGPSATFSAEFILGDCPAIDACVIQEGEITCHELLTVDFEGWPRIAGLALRIEGKVERTAPRPLLKQGAKRAELDFLPSPILSGFMPPEPRFGLLTSRGCFYRCTYCNFSAMGDWKVRYHSAERVLEELRFVSDWGRRNRPAEKPYLEFYDDALTLDVRRAKSIFSLIAAADFQIDFLCHTRVDYLDDELLYLMRQAGVISINFGLESGVPEVLRRIKKARPGIREIAQASLDKEVTFIDNIRRTIDNTKRAGIKPSVSIITGLPGETLEQGRQTLELIRSLDVYEYTHNVLRIFAGTELADTFREHGLNRTPSAFGLPYITTSAYDTFALQPLPHATIHAYQHRLIHGLRALYTGEYRSFGEFDPLAVAFDALPTAQGEVRELLRHQPVPCGTSFYFELNSTALTEQHQDALLDQVRELQSTVAHTLVELGVFSRDVNLLIPEAAAVPAGQDAGAEAASDLGRTLIWMPDLTQVDLLKRFSHRVRFVNLTSFLDRLQTFAQSPADITFLEVHTPLDLAQFQRLNAHPRYEELARLRRQHMIVFSDYCRWDTSPCPQLSTPGEFPKRVFRCDGGCLSCCASDRTRKGPPQRDRLSAYFAAQKLRWEEEKRKRGCEACPCRERCSQCLNPYPLSAEAFCAMQVESATRRTSDFASR